MKLLIVDDVSHQILSVSDTTLENQDDAALISVGANRAILVSDDDTRVEGDNYVEAVEPVIETVVDEPPKSIIEKITDFIG